MSESINDFNRSDIVNRAIILANKAHSQDMWGEHPYSIHLALTAVKIREVIPGVPMAEAAAWLHDVVEDHPEYASQVREEFPEVYEAVVNVSRKSDESYDEFIDRVIGTKDRLTISLKYADMSVNLGNNPRESLRERYEKNIDRLAEALKEFE